MTIQDKLATLATRAAIAQSEDVEALQDAFIELVGIVKEMELRVRSLEKSRADWTS